MSVDGNSISECVINTEAQSPDSVSCGFEGISSDDYYIVVEETDCGAAVNQPILTIKPPVQ